jgi:hypothetical protein
MQETQKPTVFATAEAAAWHAGKKVAHESTPLRNMGNIFETAGGTLNPAMTGKEAVTALRNEPKPTQPR